MELIVDIEVKKKETSVAFSEIKQLIFSGFPSIRWRYLVLSIMLGTVLDFHDSRNSFEIFYYLVYILRFISIIFNKPGNLIYNLVIHEIS